MHFKTFGGYSSTSFVSCLLLIFWISTALFGLFLFLAGFFPMKNVNADFAVNEDIPAQIFNLSVDSHHLYKRHVGRFVFVLIDAFRWDFPAVPEHMPYVAQLQQQGQATRLTARCHPPTATMPRIKALMTGSIPNYIDVALNLGSNQVIEDNLIHQATENDLNIVFYGDEVWLTLFPDKFMRMEGTMSFFVSDFTEVDQNVTRHIKREMLRDDWDILILHYLGLDHIGHLTGPSSSLVPSKLKEMDLVIKTLHESLQQWDVEHPENPSFLVVAGDHGMHDSGSHGGATVGEVLASLILIESPSHNVSSLKTRPEVSQIDVAATIAVLLGLPIPKSSLGVLIPYALSRLAPEQYLFALFYNAEQVAKQFSMADSEAYSTDSFKLYLKAQNTHLSWMKNKSDSLKHHAETLYFQATKQMSSQIVKSLVNFDLSALVLGCIILTEVLVCLMFWRSEGVSDSFLNTAWTVLLTAVGGISLFLCCLLLRTYGSSSLLRIAKLFNMNSFAVFLIALNCWVLYLLLHHYERVKWKSLPITSLFLRIGCVLHVITLSSSSLIEEEHQTWYYMWCTLLLLISLFCTKISYILKFKVIGILCSQRVLRKLNQTGDKWSSLPDIADWLNMPEHRILLSAVAFSSLLGVWLSLHYLQCIKNFLDKVFYCLALVCTYIYRICIGDLYCPLVTTLSRGVWVVRLFWLVWGLLLVRSLKRFKNQPCLSEAVQIFASAWVLSCTMLLRPCNVIVIPYLVFSSSVLHKIFKHPIDMTIVYSWLGTVGFYYQGNSNNLATIDVATGYIGADEQQDMLSAGLLVLIHTYSFPVLAMLLLWFHSVCETDVLQRKQDALIRLRTSFVLRLLPLSFYCILIAFNRYHLFIWSVFAPKLLYEALFSVLSFVSILVGCLSLILWQ